MKDRPGNQAPASRGRKEPTSDGRDRDRDSTTQQKRGYTLGLRAFEKISAVEGIQLSGEMRRDLKSLDARHMDDAQRSLFISGKYGKK